MPTIILNKKNFLEWVERQIQDDQIVIISPDGTKAEIKKRTNERRVEFSFVADTFLEKDSVNDIYNGSVLGCAFFIASPEQLSEETLKMLKQ